MIYMIGQPDQTMSRNTGGDNSIQLTLNVKFYNIMQYVNIFFLILDTPPYFNMSRYDKTIPDHASIDFSIIDFFFNDTDYADWFVDYEPEYGDLFFYFDTFASM